MAADKPDKKLVVGLVGGMGSGKSQVAAEFARHGARVISGDPIGHEALRVPDIRRQVIARWGQKVLTAGGEVDRRTLGAIVFADPSERVALEDLLFPWIRRRLREEIQKARNDAIVPLVVLDAAVMLEAGWNDACDVLVYVDAPRSLRLQRLAKQRGWSAEETALREKAQMPLEEKRGRADHVIDNSGELAEVARQVEKLLKLWRVSRNSEAGL
jgi:dephospho-CoA kinase